MLRDYVHAVKLCPFLSSVSTWITFAREHGIYPEKVTSPFLRDSQLLVPSLSMVGLAPKKYILFLNSSSIFYLEYDIDTLIFYLRLHSLQSPTPQGKIIILLFQT